MRKLDRHANAIDNLFGLLLHNPLLLELLQILVPLEEFRCVKVLRMEGWGLLAFLAQFAAHLVGAVFRDAGAEHRVLLVVSCQIGLLVLVDAETDDEPVLEDV